MSDEPSANVPKRNYRWPWFILAAALLGIVLYIVWMFFAVQHEKSEQFNSPPPAIR
jgi:hypothetical protein